MYLNKSKISRTNVIAMIQLISGIIFLSFFTLGFIIELNGHSKNPVFGMAIGVIGMLIFAWMIFRSVKNRNMCSTSICLNQVFESYSNGIVPASNLLMVLGVKNTLQALKKVQFLIGRKFLINCTVDYGNGMRVELYCETENGMFYESVTCPNCGAVGRCKIGYTYVCPYCGNGYNKRKHSKITTTLISFFKRR